MQATAEPTDPGATPEPFDIRTQTTEDGYVIDPTTGEIVGLMIQEFAETGHEPTEVEFAQQILKRMQVADARQTATAARIVDLEAALQAKLAEYMQEFERDPEVVVLTARKANLERIRSDAAKRYDYLWTSHYDAILRAAQVKTSPKNRTWIHEYGVVKLRKVPTNVTVLDEPRAVLLCKDLGWEQAIVVKESIAKAEFKGRIIDLFNRIDQTTEPSAEDVAAIAKVSEAGRLFDIVEAHDKCEVFTGVAPR